MERWRPSPNGCFKLNCDAALDLNTTRAGVGIVLRNNAGKVVECAALKKPPIKSVATLEAWAIFDGIRMERAVGITHLQIESDAEMVIKTLLNNSSSSSPFGQFLDGIQQQTKDFASYSLSHVRRNANRVAHDLARYSLNSDDNKHWMLFFPELFSNSLHKDGDFCNSVN